MALTTPLTNNIDYQMDSGQLANSLNDTDEDVLIAVQALGDMRHRASQPSPQTLPSTAPVSSMFNCGLIISSIN
jgi:hypothetical protein